MGIVVYGVAFMATKSIFIGDIWTFGNQKFTVIVISCRFPKRVNIVKTSL